MLTIQLHLHNFTVLLFFTGTKIGFTIQPIKRTKLFVLCHVIIITKNLEIPVKKPRSHIIEILSMERINIYTTCELTRP